MTKLSRKFSGVRQGSPVSFPYNIIRKGGGAQNFFFLHMVKEGGKKIAKNFKKLKKTLDFAIG